MKRIAVAFTLLLALTALAVMVSPGSVARAANNSEQVVFSGTGFSQSTGLPFGFWIWCEGDSGNPYHGLCNGAMYFYTLHITKHVSGTVTESNGAYTMGVASSDQVVACSLTNVPPPTHGPTNTVMVSCTAPAVFTDGLSTNAVVNVTGP